MTNREQTSAGKTRRGALRILTWALLLLPILALASVPERADAQVVINEIMYHPAGDTLEEEFIELFNAGSQPEPLFGWRLADGVDFKFPNVTLAPGAYLVVASDLTSFTAKYPEAPVVLGEWEGRLSDKGERIKLENAAGLTIDAVVYADQGDWTRREEGPLDRGHRGWVWSDAHDGGGKSLELVNQAMPNDLGQNWAASLIDGGTPGAANSVATSITAPLILDVAHAPAIPGGGVPVAVTARLLDDGPTTPGATVYYRLDGAATFTSLTMADNGLNGDGEAGDGLFGAMLPPQANGAIVEFYIRALDDAGSSRTEPAPIQSSGLQSVNFLYLVQDSSMDMLLLLPRASQWRYLDDGSAPDAAWRAAAFDDSAWKVGAAQLGYGDGDEATVIDFGVDPDNKHVTAYFRKTFNVDDPSKITELTLRLLRDDGAVVYLNGAEVLRNNMPQGKITSRTLASGSTNSETTYHEFPLDPADLLQGPNLFAVEIHQGSPDSSDLSFDLELATSAPSEPIWQLGDQPTYYLIMTDAERAELADMGDNDSDGDHLSNAQMNATFISLDETGIQVRYNVGIRNRGHGSRRRPPMNYHVNFPHDRPWRDATAININSQYPHSQLIGGKIFALAGHQPANVRAVQTRVNGSNLALSNSRMYGSYAAVETLDSEYADAHFPDDPNGNLYKCFRRDGTSLYAELRYLGEDPEPYRKFYFKQTNDVEDDWSALIDLTNTLNNAPEDIFVQEVNRVIDLDQWLHYLALDTLLLNRETGLNRGIGDDYAIYQGVEDPRFKLVPHDLDTIMYLGAEMGSINHDIFTFKQVAGLRRMLEHPEIVPLYYRAFFDVIESTFNPRVLNPLIDEILGGFVPVSRRETTKQFVLARTAAVLAQIPHELVVRSNLLTIGGYPRSIVDQAALTGSADASRTVSILVEGQLVDDYSPISGAWSFGSSGPPPDGKTTGVLLDPGLNRIFVQAFDAPGGAGQEVDRAHIDIWYDPSGQGGGDPTSKTLDLDLQVRDSYLPGVPVLIRAEALGEDGQIDRGLWDGVVTLSTNRPLEATLFPAQITLYNGFGSALLQIVDTNPARAPVTIFASLDGNEAQASRTLTNLARTPVTEVSGVLAGTTTTWSGLIHVTGDVLAPAGHTLIIEPSTLVLLDGNPAPLSETGVDIDIEGAIRSLGTKDHPVTFTAINPGAPWGEIHHQGAAPSLYQHTHITRAGHAPLGGHTNSGPAIRSISSVIVFDHTSITDIAGKAMQIDDALSLGSRLEFRHSEFARSVMGPEMYDTELLFEDSYIIDMLGIYRDDNYTNDNDGIYLHAQRAGQTITLTRSVLAHGNDDGVDTLNSVVTLNDVIIRDFDDKGVSVSGGETTFNGGIIAGCDIGIEAKNSSAIARIDRSTIAATANGVRLPSSASGAFISNSIIRGDTDSVFADNPSDMRITYSNLGEPWSGVGNSTENPLFVSIANRDFRLQEGSPAIDAADPAAPTDPDGSRADMGYFFPPAPPGTGNPVGTELPGGQLTSDTLLSAASGPYTIMGDIIVPVGLTLAVEPGATLFFATDTKLIVHGRLLAEGTEFALIRFTWLPGGGPWDGIQFVDSMEENRIAHAVLEHAVTDNGMIGLENSRLLIDNAFFDHTDRRRIRTLDSSLIVRNSFFADIFKLGQAPSTDNMNEHIWGAEVAEGGEFLLENNYFGTTTGHNDLVDFDSKTPGRPMPRFMNNIFAGSGDDALDLEGDAYIEGNLFQNLHKDQFNVDPGESNAISAGDGHQFTVARNIFQNIGHVSLVKEGSSMTFVNNTVVGAAAAALYFDLEGQTSGPGQGAYIDGNIFYDTPVLLAEVTTATELSLHRSIVPSGSVPLGVGNLDADPLLTKPYSGDFSLLPGSPALRSGPNGLDMGALVPAGASISGEPSARTVATSATLTIGGPGVTHYRFSRDGAAYGPETPVAAPIQLTALPLGDVTIRVIGKNAAGVWQATADSVERAWTVVSETTLVGLRLTEIMYNPADASPAEIDAGHDNNDDFEFLEFQNAGETVIDLGGFAFASGLTFAFPSPTILAPDEYLLLARDPAAFRFRYTDAAIRVVGPYGGKLSNSGERLLLLDALGAVVFDFEYSDSGDWPSRADGDGSSLVFDASTVAYGNAENWRPSVELGGSPGQDALAQIRTVLINETLTHTDPPQSDAIELLNATTATVALDGWFLSDYSADLFKFPLTTTTRELAPGEYLVFDESDFNPSLGANPSDFALSGAHGDAVFLVARTAGEQTLFIDHVEFGAAINGESFGRWPNAATELGTVDSDGLLSAFYPMLTPTLGKLNSGPRVGPLAVTEVHYHPVVSPDSEPLESNALEFVEITNPAATTVSLTGWRIRKGIRFDFPSGASLAPLGVIVLVSFDPASPLDAERLAAFRAAYNIDETVALTGPFIGSLSNGGETIQLRRPDEPPLAEPTFVPYLIEDEASYDDQFPWPAAADGHGMALTRQSAQAYGNDARNWSDAPPTPGRVVFAAPDEAPAITSDSPTTHALVGSEFRHVIIATGRPSPVIKITGLPDWLVFDGNDILVGAPDRWDARHTPPITITATNRVGADTQTFQIVITFDEPSPAVIMIR